MSRDGPVNPEVNLGRHVQALIDVRHSAQKKRGKFNIHYTDPDVHRVI